MAFTKQGGAIEQALVTGGFSPLQANSLMYAIANCSQPLEHRGPFTISYVPQQVRLVTPEKEKYAYEKFNFTTSEGERRAFQPKPPTDFCAAYPDSPECIETPACDLSTTCDRLDSLDERMRNAEEALQEAAQNFRDIADALAAANAAVAELQSAVSAIQQFLSNTTDCPSP
jgi:hypothetical protein